MGCSDVYSQSLSPYLHPFHLKKKRNIFITIKPKTVQNQKKMGKHKKKKKKKKDYQQQEVDPIFNQKRGWFSETRKQLYGTMFWFVSGDSGETIEVTDVLPDGKKPLDPASRDMGIVSMMAGPGFDSQELMHDDIMPSNPKKTDPNDKITASYLESTLPKRAPAFNYRWSTFG